MTLTKPVSLGDPSSAVIFVVVCVIIWPVRKFGSLKHESQDRSKDDLGRGERREDLEMSC